MKLSLLLIVLGFSQVFGRNYEPLTASKFEREDQLDNKIEVVNNNLADSEAEPSDLAQPKIDVSKIPYCRNNRCFGSWHLKKSTLGKVIILGVESLLSSSPWLLLIFYNLGENKTPLKFEILHIH